MSFYNLCKSELADLLQKAGFERYRATQLFKCIYQKNKTGGAGLTAESFLPEKLRQYIENNLQITPVGTVDQEHLSKLDGTRKCLIGLDSPKYKVETVLIPDIRRNTLCVSSQVGCSLSCTFCHTGTQKLLKNLSTSEIISQFLLMKQRVDGGKIDNVVFMGQGEPLYNWRNVSRAVKILTDKDGIGLGHGKITISTSGITPLIPKISEELGVQLAISLHATNDTLRSQIMPINNTYGLKALMEACEKYLKHSKSSNRRITFEYVMLKGVNDCKSKDAPALVKLLSNLPAHVNLIPFNKWPGSPYESTPIDRIQEFNDFLNSRGLRSTIRWSKGEDIYAACGQLKSDNNTSAINRSLAI